jgi:hypothetical protein
MSTAHRTKAPVALQELLLVDEASLSVRGERLLVESEPLLVESEPLLVHKKQLSLRVTRLG